MNLASLETPCLVLIRAIGEKIRILPNHACATAAQYDRYQVIDGGPDIADVWRHINGW